MLARNGIFGRQNCLFFAPVCYHKIFSIKLNPKYIISFCFPQRKYCFLVKIMHNSEKETEKERAKNRMCWIERNLFHFCGACCSVIREIVVCVDLLFGICKHNVFDVTRSRTHAYTQTQAERENGIQHFRCDESKNANCYVPFLSTVVTLTFSHLLDSSNGGTSSRKCVALFPIHLFPVHKYTLPFFGAPRSEWYYISVLHLTVAKTPHQLRCGVGGV